MFNFGFLRSRSITKVEAKGYVIRGGCQVLNKDGRAINTIAFETMLPFQIDTIHHGNLHRVFPDTIILIGYSNKIFRSGCRLHNGRRI